MSRDEEHEGESYAPLINEASNLTDEEALQEEALHELAKSVPLDGRGLPLAVYRPDALPMDKYRKRMYPTEDEVKDEAEDGQPSEPDPETWAGDYNSLADGLLGLNEGDESGEGEGDGSSFEGEEAPQSGFDLVPGSDAGEVQKWMENHTLVAGFTPDELQLALVRLEFGEGYPAQPDGRTFWNRLPYEPPEAFDAFNAYIHYAQVKKGPRKLEDLPEFMQHHGGPTVDLRRIRFYATVYYWQWRAAAYDIFCEQAYRRQMQWRQQEAQDDHYNFAQKTLERLKQYIDDEEEFWEVMSPKVAIDLLGKITSLQRVSAGLPASAPPSEGGSKGGSAEVTIRQGGAGGAGAGGDSSGRGVDSSGRVIDLGSDGSVEGLTAQALQDPETANLFQELVIKLNTGEQ